MFYFLLQGHHMEKKEILFRYASHYDAIKKIGEYPLGASLQLSDLGDLKEMKAITQKCYKEISRDRETGIILEDISVIDYLCRISTLYLIELYKEKGVALAVAIVRGYFENSEETKNLLRYFIKNPFFILTGNEDMKCFQIIGGFWLKLLEGKDTTKKYWENQIKDGFISIISQLNFS